MLLLSIVLVGLTSVLLAIHWYQTRSRTAKLLNAFPTLDMLPIIGNVHILSTNPETLFPQIRKLLLGFKETFSAWSGYYGSIHIITAEDAEIILSSMKYIDKGILYEFFTPWLGTGLLTSAGAKWQQRRKFLTPAFHFNILQKFVEIFGEHCENLVDRLKEESKNSKTDIVPVVSKFTLSTICETAMGLKLEAHDSIQNDYFQALHKIGSFIIHRALSPWLHTNIAYFLTPYMWQLRKNIQFLHKFTTKVIQTREVNFQMSDVTNMDQKPDENDLGIKKKRMAMLDLLIYVKRQSGQIDDEGIREEVDTFVFEGHDTTSLSICMTLLLLAHNKDVQQQIVEELNEIFGDSKRHASYDDLLNMKYLERCIKESLRLYPSVPLMTRRITEEVKLTKHVAPAGVEVFVHIYNIHRDERYFPDPEKFNPDRFLPENMKDRHNFAYIPFSAGPRNCIGQKFAMLELKSIISSIFRNFTLEPVDDIADLRWVVDLVLRVKGGIHIKFVPRT